MESWSVDTYREFDGGVLVPPRLRCDGKGCCLAKEQGVLYTATIEVSGTTTYQLYMADQILNPLETDLRLGVDMYNNLQFYNPSRGYVSFFHVKESEMDHCKVNGELGYIKQNSEFRECVALTVCRPMVEIEIVPPSETSGTIQVRLSNKCSIITGELICLT